MAITAEAVPIVPTALSSEMQVDPRIARAAAGDAGAAQELLVELAPRIRNVVRYMVRGDDRVDDLAQDALLAIYRGLPEYRPIGSFQAWAQTVAVRAVLSTLRKMKRHRRDVLIEDPDVIPIGTSAADPDRYFARRRLARLLDRLPDEQRVVLVLHHSAGMTTFEIADELGVPHETVRSRLRIAKNRLRTLLPTGEKP